MYKVLRSVGIKTGAALEGLQLAQESTEYINKNYPEASVNTYIQIFGDLGKIVWIADYETLANVEEVGQKLTVDEGYLGIVSKFSDLVIEGSWKDELFRGI